MTTKITSQEQFLLSLDTARAGVMNTFDGEKKKVKDKYFEDHKPVFQAKYDAAEEYGKALRKYDEDDAKLMKIRDDAIKALEKVRDADIQKIEDKRACELKRDMFSIEGSGSPGSESCFGRAYNDDGCRSSFSDIPRIWSSDSLVCPDAATCEALGGYGACTDIGYDPANPGMGRRYNDNHTSHGTNTNAKGEKSYKCPRTVPCNPSGNPNEVTSCSGWDCTGHEGKFCPPSAQGSGGDGYCCINNEWTASNRTACLGE